MRYLSTVQKIGVVLGIVLLAVASVEEALGDKGGGGGGGTVGDDDEPQENAASAGASHFASRQDTDDSTKNAAFNVESKEGRHPPSSCENLLNQCNSLADAGECDTNPKFMKEHCPLVCGFCIHAKKYEPENVKPRRVSLGVSQVLDGEEYGVSPATIQLVVDSASEYMLATFPTMDDDEDRVGLVGQRNISPSPSCRNEHELCGLWAAMGECQANPRYMEQICAPVCHSCHHSVLLVEHQQSPCTWNPAQNSWESGDLDRMFRRLTSDPYLKSKHKIQIHSSPDLKDGDGGGDDGGPWIITMEGVVDPEEAEQLIELGEQEGFQASTSSTDDDHDNDNSSKHSRHRTSFNTCCQNECYKNETAQQVMRRLSDLIGIVEPNSEFLQLLRYSPGQ